MFLKKDELNIPTMFCFFKKENGDLNFCIQVLSYGIYYCNAFSCLPPKSNISIIAATCKA